MKILFLDIDGVLNSQDWFERTRRRDGGKLIVPIEPYPLGHIDPQAVKLLNHIVESTRCKIVISSTWRRHNTLDAIAGYLAAKGFRHEVAIIGATPKLGGERGDEIAAWLSTHPGSRFAIVDDDTDMGKLLPFLVQTNWMTGLTETEAEKIVNLLSSSVDHAAKVNGLSVVQPNRAAADGAELLPAAR